MKALCKSDFYLMGVLQKRGDVINIEESSYENAEKKGLVEKVYEAEVKETKKAKKAKEAKNRSIDTTPVDRQIKTGGRKRRKK